MNNFLALDVAGVHLPWQMVLAGAVAAVWILTGLITVASPQRMRTPFAVTTFVLAAGWGVAFDAKSMVGSRSDVTTASAMQVTTKREGSCASIQNNMTGNEVRRRLGAPDEIRNDDKVRGPGSSVLIYRDLRCAVHLFDERVELID